MGYCLNPACGQPRNPEGHRFCQTCGTRLALGDRYEALQPLGQYRWLGWDRQALVQPQVLIQACPPQGKTTLEQRDERDRQRRHWAALATTLSDLPHWPPILAIFESPWPATPSPSGLAHWVEPLPSQGHYLVQGFGAGERLAQRLQGRSGLDSVEVLALLVDGLTLLHGLHERGFLHRNITPYTLYRPGEGFPWRLGEVGSIVAVGEGVATPDPVGPTGLGSAEYSAPELLQGQGEARSDLYSLAVCGLQALTGLRPFDLFDGVNGGWRWRMLVPEVTEPLATVLDGLGQPVLGDRIASAAEALTRLGYPPPRRTPAPPSRPISPRPWIPQQVRASGLPLQAAVGGGLPTPGVVAITQGGELVRWPWPQGTGWEPWPGAPQRLRAIALDPTTGRLALGDQGGGLWMQTGTGWSGPHPHHQRPLTRLLFTPQGSLFSLGEGREWAHWHPQGATWALKSHGTWPQTITAWACQGECLALGDSNGAIALGHWPSGAHWRTLAAHRGAITALAWAEDGRTLVSGGLDLALHWQCPSTSRQIHRHPQPGLPSRVLLPLAGDTWVSGGGGGLLIWPATGHRPSHHGSALDATPILGLFSLGEEGCLSLSRGGTLALWAWP